MIPGVIVAEGVNFEAPPPIQADKRWRLKFNGTEGGGDIPNWPSIIEVEFRTDVGGANPIADPVTGLIPHSDSRHNSNGTARASSAAVNWDAGLAFNGEPNRLYNYWWASKIYDPNIAWIEFEFFGVTEVLEVGLHVTSVSKHLYDIDVQSFDGANWNTVNSFSLGPSDYVLSGTNALQPQYYQVNTATLVL